jgi:hypothetical protein
MKEHGKSEFSADDIRALNERLHHARVHTSEELIVLLEAIYSKATAPVGTVCP